MVATVIGVADDVWMRGRFRFTDLWRAASIDPALTLRQD
jgi:hypothetical protein